VNKQDGLPMDEYALIRCFDGTVVATFKNIPDDGRVLFSRSGDDISFFFLRPDDIVGTQELFTEMLEKAGYKLKRGSDTLHS